MPRPIGGIFTFPFPREAAGSQNHAPGSGDGRYNGYSFQLARPVCGRRRCNFVSSLWHALRTLHRRQRAGRRALANNGLPRPTAPLDFYRQLRDRIAPNKPIWLTETAQAACGGDRWAATFLDTFRYLDQLGRLAKAGVHVVMHNTLAASDYGLLDERTFAPRPNYWAALLWRRLMGTTVLDASVPGRSGLHVHAHCLKGMPGGVSVLVLNTDRNAAATLVLANTSERYTLDATKLGDPTLRLNGHALALRANGELPDIAGVAAPAGTLSFAPATITFLAIRDARNRACR